MEGVYPELLLISTPAKGVGTLLLNGERLALQGASKVIPKLGIVAEKYPKTTETVIGGTVATGVDIYNGELSYEKTLANYALAGIKAGKPTSQQIAIDSSYTLYDLGNDIGKDDSQKAWHATGKVVSITSATGLDLLLMKKDANPIFRQILSNSVVGYAESKFNTKDEK
ncbi:hypothetical protein [Rodentibacter trehalosifermentans]|uniref:hypothetical protein n=1 Tax=Rodentibacter trehalosifermentans TaxID=1908263 RepID=UPI00117BC1CB|nr:hypothetical protein [Rodentibacter trehalosifermentans]